jgi:molecular chaperone DnaK (HSP70)
LTSASGADYLSFQLSTLNFTKMSKFSIGIDLGTTNCAMAYVPLNGTNSTSETFPVLQWETHGSLTESLTLPSFLYLPREDEASQLLGKGIVGREWIAGRFARRQAAESPGRVAHSAKSWLCHHAIDRNAPFLPWRSDDIPIEKRISPIQASALLLEYLRAAWNTRFAGEDADFVQQEVTVTVPASFDAVAQRLTLDAASEAGFPSNVRLLEEPQAAFYRWLEEHPAPDAFELPPAGVSHVLVVDIGGGTSDFSLFEMSPQPGSMIPHIKRIAVSDHLLLGGDNIDLALAHHIQQQLATDLSPTQWNFLAARCRDLKERCLTDSSQDEQLAISIPSQGSSLLSKTLSARISRKEVETLVLEGFFPECGPEERPSRVQAALREWALPYAPDSAVTRYLADFLRGRPPVDFLLFNGGSLHAEAVRLRLQRQVSAWQAGNEPKILSNSEPDLAVARGAARFGGLIHRRAARIEAGAARAIYLEVHRPGGKERAESTLVCILPKDAPAEEEFKISQPGLELRINHPVRFQPYYSTRHDDDKSGTLVPWNESDFHHLPPLQTIARLDGPRSHNDRVPVSLSARMNELGLLKIACQSIDPRLKHSWPLEFNLRQEETDGGRDQSTPDAESGVESAKLAGAGARMRSLFSRPLDKRDKLSATNLLKNLEQILGLQKANWNGVLLRQLWQTLYEQINRREESVDHEEAWLILAGFFMRPGFGAHGDESRIDQLWQIKIDGLTYPGKRIQLQEYILWRRVSGGLSQARQQAVIEPELPKLLSQKSPSPELIRLAGSFERIPQPVKEELTDQFIKSAQDFADKGEHCAPYLVALGLLLNRAPLYAPTEDVLPSEYVERAYEALCHLDWANPELVEAQTLFLRAARVTNHAVIDLPHSLREKIASKLEKSGLAPVRVEKLRRFVPVERADRASLFGESLPPGLVLGNEPNA